MKETVTEHNKASAILADFACDGLSLLDGIYQKFKSEQQITLVLDSNSETTFRKAVKMAMSGSRDDAIIWLYGKLSSEQSLRENL